MTGLVRLPYKISPTHYKNNASLPLRGGASSICGTPNRINNCLIQGVSPSATNCCLTLRRDFPHTFCRRMLMWASHGLRRPIGGSIPAGGRTFPSRKGSQVQATTSNAASPRGRVHGICFSPVENTSSSRVQPDTQQKGSQCVPIQAELSFGSQGILTKSSSFVVTWPGRRVGRQRCGRDERPQGPRILASYT